MSEGEVRKGLQTSAGTRKLQEGTENKGSPGHTNFNPGSSQTSWETRQRELSQMSWRRGVPLYMIRTNKARGVSWHTGISFVVIDWAVISGVTHIQFRRRGESNWRSEPGKASGEREEVRVFRRYLGGGCLRLRKPERVPRRSSRAAGARVDEGRQMISEDKGKQHWRGRI